MFLAAAGATAGVVGTAGGITSLVAYPALLAAGITPLAANVTNSVALLGSGFSSTLRARRDVAGHSATLRTWLPLTVLASLAGALLLVATPGTLFDAVVPALVATGSVVLLLQPTISRRLDRRRRRPRAIATSAAGAMVALYNGYFGAGSGILLVSLLLLTTEPVLYRANSLKNVILFCADVLPAVVFAISGTVVWSAAAPLAAGAIAGGLTGPWIARRAPADVLRRVIAAGGLALAFALAGRSVG